MDFLTGLQEEKYSRYATFCRFHYEFSFDTFKPDRSRIYRVVVELNSRAGGSFFVGGVENPLPETVAKELTGLDLVVPFRSWQNDATISLPTAKGGKSTVYIAGCP